MWEEGGEGEKGGKGGRGGRGWSRVKDEGEEGGVQRK